jgi:integrin alpha 8
MIKTNQSLFVGQVFSQNLRNRMDLSSSQEGPDTADNNYLGYSLAIGDFTGSGRDDLAVGMPRSANLTGKVIRSRDLCLGSGANFF